MLDEETLQDVLRASNGDASRAREVLRTWALPDPTSTFASVKELRVPSATKALQSSAHVGDAVSQASALSAAARAEVLPRPEYDAVMTKRLVRQASADSFLFVLLRSRKVFVDRAKAAQRHLHEEQKRGSLSMSRVATHEGEHAGGATRGWYGVRVLKGELSKRKVSCDLYVVLRVNGQEQRTKAVRHTTCANFTEDFTLSVKGTFDGQVELWDLNHQDPVLLGQAKLPLPETLDPDAQAGQDIRLKLDGGFVTLRLTWRDLWEDSPASPREAFGETSREAGIKEGQLLLSQRLDFLQLMPVEMGDDGNCQFRALSMELYGTEERHGELREVAVAHMRAFPDEFAVFVDGDWNKYLDSMSMLRTWADELTLRACADALVVRIHVITSAKENWYLKYDSTSTPVRELFLTYIEPIHYNTLRPMAQQPRPLPAKPATEVREALARAPAAQSGGYPSATAVHRGHGTDPVQRGHGPDPVQRVPQGADPVQRAACGTDPFPRTDGNDAVPHRAAHGIDPVARVPLGTDPQLAAMPPAPSRAPPRISKDGASRSVKEGKGPACGDEVTSEMTEDYFHISMGKVVRALCNRGVTTVETAFDHIDVDGNRTLSHDEVTNALRNLGAHLSNWELDQIFGRLDLTGNGAVRLEDFRAVLMRCKMAESPNAQLETSVRKTLTRVHQAIQRKGKKLRDVFKLMATKNNNRTVTKDQFLDLIKSFNSQLTNVELLHLWQYADKNGDNTLDYEEFVSLFDGV